VRRTNSRIRLSLTPKTTSESSAGRADTPWNDARLGERSESLRQRRTIQSSVSLPDREIVTIKPTMSLAELAEKVYYRWRPNLPDEGDNHVLELAVAAGDAPIVTFNRRDFRSGEMRFPGIIVQTPGAWLKSLAPLKE
jgi:hypothetical protein